MDFTKTMGRSKGRLSYNRLERGALGPNFGLVGCLTRVGDPIPAWPRPLGWKGPLPLGVLLPDAGAVPLCPLYPLPRPLGVADPRLESYP